MKLKIIAAGIVAMAITVRAQGQWQLSVTGEITSGFSGLVSAAFDTQSGLAWVYPNFGTVIQTVNAPTNQLAVPRPGEAADDADLDFVTTPFTLGTNQIPAGTLLFFNGESGSAEVYAINPPSGAVIGTLQTAFGQNHVVGGAFHPIRKTLFLLADKLDGLAPSRIAEINPTTGQVINSFGTGDANYTINYGDIDANGISGDLYLVSSDESTIRQLTADGVFVQEWPLPSLVTSLSGIALDEQNNRAFVSGTGGKVWILDNLITRPTMTITYLGSNQAEICWAGTRGYFHVYRRNSWAPGSDWQLYLGNIGALSTGRNCFTQPIAINNEPTYYRVEVTPATRTF